MSQWEGIRQEYAQKPIRLGLERVVRVWLELGGKRPAFAIAVAGTNGKGSCCFLLDGILRAAGYRVGLYTSPHLLTFRERIRVGGNMATEEALDAAFCQVAACEGADALTQFELDTLAAMLIMDAAKVDVAILEVGLGGRLDAVNVFDADCALLTSVDYDHMDYLGDTLEQIGLEKAGIFREGKPAVCGGAMPPSVSAYAAQIGADLRVSGQDFGYEPADAGHWRFWSRAGWRMTLPVPALRGDYQLGNAAVCLAALERLQADLPVALADIQIGLSSTTVPGRFQIMPGQPTVILDVGHNPHAALGLVENLRKLPCAGRTLAVFAMLADKDIAGTVRAVSAEIDTWFVGGIQQPRGCQASALAAVVAETAAGAVPQVFADVSSAFAGAKFSAKENDRIIAFGSFHTVADVLRALTC